MKKLDYLRDLKTDEVSVWQHRESVYSDAGNEIGYRNLEWKLYPSQKKLLRAWAIGSLIADVTPFHGKDLAEMILNPPKTMKEGKPLYLPKPKE